ncbi:lipoprotein [Caballeronia temeraria]|uniref:Lipoprotein n=1 Tax=Caballeronia temeraria TaxID=1777137 RepID=A0A158DW12_9BURK|nr:XdhC family protein [Caballeronia temeraria]SAK98744.1 lipoprotein [Caballeronia temeraria]
MDSVDLEVLKNSARWLEEGHRVLLVTVVKTWGSSPRPEGAMLAVRDDGHVVGSVSGGCIEDDLIDRVRQRGIEQTKPEAVKYGISAEEAHRFGLPCGGTIQLVLEPLTMESGISELCAAVESGRLVARTLDMATGAARLEPAQATDGVLFDDAHLLTIHGPRYRMLVIGAGQLSRYLCSIAVGLDYQVTVCDPREEYTEEWNVPGTTIVRTMPDDTVMEMKLDERCAVIALTHDPKLDDLALMEALKTPAFYVGALGSRRNNAARRERLKEFDLSEAELARLHGPVGIYIGSRTPPEIAVSILAEVTAAKNGVLVHDLLKIEGAKAAREPT